MGLNIKWDITHTCNLNCAHCIKGDDLGKIENELNMEEISNVLDKLSNLDIEYIHLLGGEPTARKDFVTIMKEFNLKGIDFGFNTNGLKMKDEKIINEIAYNKKIRNIVFSLEGPNPEINDLVRGKKVFDLTVDSIKKIVELKRTHNLENLKITINTVLSKANIDYISEMIDFCISLDIDQFVILQLLIEGNAINNDMSISLEEEIRIVEVIANKYNKVKDKLEITPRFTYPISAKYVKNVLNLEFPQIIHGCGAGTDFAYINNKGELFPCDRYVYQIKNDNCSEDISLTKNDFFDIWNLEGFDNIYILSEGIDFYKDIYPCNNCEFLQKTCYPCPLTINKDSVDKTVKGCERYLELIKESI